MCASAFNSSPFTVHPPCRPSYCFRSQCGVQPPLSVPPPPLGLPGAPLPSAVVTSSMACGFTADTRLFSPRQPVTDDLHSEEGNGNACISVQPPPFLPTPHPETNSLGHYILLSFLSSPLSFSVVLGTAGYIPSRSAYRHTRTHFNRQAVAVFSSFFIPPLGSY